jgi:hypothetical protein
MVKLVWRSVRAGVPPHSDGFTGMLSRSTVIENSIARVTVSRVFTSTVTLGLAPDAV